MDARGALAMMRLMQGTNPSPASARRKASAPLPSPLRAQLGAALDTNRPEVIAVRAEVSTATVRRALAGEAVSPLVRAALARALDGINPPVAA